MKRRSKELQQQKKEGRRPQGGFGGGYGGGGYGAGIGSKSYSSGDPSITSYHDTTPKPSYTPSTSKTGGGMKLSKKKDAESFVKKIESEGQREYMIVRPVCTMYI